MNIQLRSFVWLEFLLYWKWLQVTSSEISKNTWVKAVRDCYSKQSVLESNITVLKTYMKNENVDDIWVGSFEALLPWIEIRGCYNIPLTCNSLDRDEKKANNSAVCQLQCRTRGYFAFNQHTERCVCFDDPVIVENESKNARLCSQCEYQNDCDAYAVAYKVFDGIIKEIKGHDCLSYQCTSDDSGPMFSVSKCNDYIKSYCRNGHVPGENIDQPFYQYIIACGETQFSYPLLHSENPINLCAVSSITAVSIWVGVYRQTLYFDLGRTVLKNEDFYQIENYITQCQHLSMNNSTPTENCNDGGELKFYKCTPGDTQSNDTYFDLQIDSHKSSSPTPACGLEDVDIRTDDQKSGLIAGTVTSIFLVVVIVGVGVFIYRRRRTLKTPQIKDERGQGDQPKNNTYAHENNYNEQHHEIDITLGPYSFAKPLADTNSRLDQAEDDGNAYSRIVSTVFRTSNVPEKTNHVISNPRNNDLQTKVDTKTNSNENRQSSYSLTDNMKPADYCLAKPITDQGEMNPYTYNADYDHLSNVKKSKENTVKIYDHVPNIIDSDVTYDHSTIKICKADSNNYDHFVVQN